ncbi:MAG: HAD-IIIC family phosphatase [Planctomycetaceae bacterium]|nr:HAD-IIIC family phosphatase [Planctomycetaceae bacterium]
MNEQITKILDEMPAAPSWLYYRRAAGQLRALAASGANIFANGFKVAFTGSFTMEPVSEYAIVEAARQDIGLDVYVAPYGQFSREMLDTQSGLYAFKPDLTFLMVEPTAAGTDQETADHMVSLAHHWSSAGNGTLLVCTFAAPPDWPLHLLASTARERLQKANQYLIKALANDPRIQILDLDALAAYFGYVNAFSPQMLAMARVPFSEAFLKLLGQKIGSCVKAVKGLSAKCLVLDCDNTLWGGIIGEDGLDGIALGPDSPGREFVEFQKAILELYEQGVILAINSKNNEADVLEVLRRHPHMLLREKHFAALVVNWQSKADNMNALAQELNISLDSMVFADDNPVERQLLRQMLPQVKILDLPANPALYAQTLRQTDFFTKASLSEEDRQRGAMYAAQRQRTQLQQSSVSLEDFLKSLEMVCSIRKAEAKDVKRAAQLTQRTNQFNLTTRRYTEAEIAAMLPDKRRAVYVLGLKDKFGDNGTVGLAIVNKQTESWRIDTFLMSCRVIGRQAEDALVDRICRDAQLSNVKQLTAEYLKTPKNALAADFWDKMNFIKTSLDEKTSQYKCDLERYAPKEFKYLKLISINQN